jgi:hypothetical protein
MQKNLLSNSDSILLNAWSQSLLSLLHAYKPDRRRVSRILIRDASNRTRDCSSLELSHLVVPQRCGQRCVAVLDYVAS